MPGRPTRTRPPKGDSRCDLHIHTCFSDGLLTPEQVVRRARELGLAAVAISDHDAVGAIPRAARTAESLDVELVPAIEMSCLHRKTDVHILGYYLDYRDPSLLEFLAQVQEKRLERARLIVGKLNQLGVKLDVKRVLEIAQGAALGRPHIAQALLERGHIKTQDEAFVKFIGYHSPAYVPKMQIALTDAVKLIRNYGGIPVMAHPGTYKEKGLLDDAIQAGVAGIEVYHPDHSTAQSARLLEAALKNHLFVTGGSDCHGGRKGRVLLGETTVPYHYLAEMRGHDRNRHDSGSCPRIA